MVEAWQVPGCGTDFNKLLRANVYLYYVNVDFGRTAQLFTNEITDFISLLKVCSCLNHVEITYGMSDNMSEEMPDSERVKEIRNACVPLRNKSFSISVNDVYYLPK